MGGGGAEHDTHTHTHTHMYTGSATNAPSATNASNASNAAAHAECCTEKQKQQAALWRKSIQAAALHSSSDWWHPRFDADTDQTHLITGERLGD